MERERIERLAMDSAVGELNEDAEVLLRAYLAEHPEANQWAQDIVRICQKTKAAIDAKTRAAGAGVEVTAVKTRPLLAAKWLSVARWAAVVVFAAFIGVGLGRWSKSPALPDKPERVAVSPGPIAKRPGYTPTDSGESFWRAKAIAALRPRRHQTHKGDTQYGNLWERYGQYIKEKYYE